MKTFNPPPDPPPAPRVEIKVLAAALILLGFAMMACVLGFLSSGHVLVLMLGGAILFPAGLIVGLIVLEYREAQAKRMLDHTFDEVPPPPDFLAIWIAQSMLGESSGDAAPNGTPHIPDKS